MANYYNDFDPKACAWLRELIDAGLIPPGDVDDRSIADVRPSDLAGYAQCHFFAGIGGWPLAIRWAGLADTPGIWTGSCPCQPFSSAGKRKGHADERHLWPEFARLIRECRPSVVVGEQVEGAVRLGWLDGVFADLEREGYACGAAVLGAHSVGAPHIRQRLFWVADASKPRLEGYARHGDDGNEPGRVGADAAGSTAASRELGGLADAAGFRREQLPALGRGNVAGACGTTVPQRWTTIEPAGSRAAGVRWDGTDEFEFDWLADAERQRARPGGEREQGREGQRRDRPAIDGDAGGMGNAAGDGRDQRRAEPGRPVVLAETCRSGWSSFDIFPCRDGKARRVERQPESLADGVPALVDAVRDAGLSEDQIAAAVETWPLVESQVGRAMLLKGYGNAIVPQVAVEFVEAWKECQ